MTRITLLCAGGVSTSFLAKSMEKSIAKRGLDMTVNAYSGTHLYEVIEESDVILLAPQAMYFEDKLKPLCQQYKKPYAPIDSKVYRCLNGEALLDLVLALLKR